MAFWSNSNCTWGVKKDNVWRGYTEFHGDEEIILQWYVTAQGAVRWAQLVSAHLNRRRQTHKQNPSGVRVIIHFPSWSQRFLCAFICCTQLSSVHIPTVPFYHLPSNPRPHETDDQWKMANDNLWLDTGDDQFSWALKPKINCCIWPMRILSFDWLADVPLFSCNVTDLWPKWPHVEMGQRCGHISSFFSSFSQIVVSVFLLTSHVRGLFLRSLIHLLTLQYLLFYSM